MSCEDMVCPSESSHSQQIQYKHLVPQHFPPPGPDDGMSRRCSEWCPALCQVYGQNTTMGRGMKQGGKGGRVYEETGGLWEIRNNALSPPGGMLLSAVSTSASISTETDTQSIHQWCVISCNDRSWLWSQSVGHWLNDTGSERTLT